MRIAKPVLRPVAVPAWRLDAAQLLEEHHLVAWSPQPENRRLFAWELAEHLARFEDTQVCMIRGEEVRDLASLRDELRAVLDVGQIAARMEGPGGIIDGLSRRASATGEPALKRRFFIWSDADVLLRTDHRLFGRVVDAIAGVAAESEYASEDMLFLQRAVFVGSSVLDVYAEDPRGQFRSWWAEDGEDPFWSVVTGRSRPVFLRYRIEDAAV
ncbi:MAG: hypothetical protein KF699_15315 [Phycisphaeraceae bacterium]|nr:hypothetical protein [Phycisphaeraceae bacterium]MBX3407322.1 hypothetical protein [Phycisphaeraceae bacterium]